LLNNVTTIKRFGVECELIVNFPKDYSRAFHAWKAQRIGGGIIKQRTKKMVGNGSNSFGCIGCICSSKRI
jgi:hypothetical protein